MLKNFQLAAIVKKGAETGLLGIPLLQALQKDLANSWQAQYEAFIANVEEIEFNAGYKPEAHELFCLEDHELPAWLSAENSQTVPDLETISDHEEQIESIKSIVAFARIKKGEELVLFQNFSRSHVIQPGRFLLLRKNTYETTQSPGLSLAGELSAVYRAAKGTLLFRNFRTVNTFLPLADFYKEASEQEIREVLDHKLLAPEDADVVVADSNQWSRKRFAMLLDSGVLDKYSARQIKARSKGYDVEVHISKGQIVFPSDKHEAKKLLQFLNEERFRGAITKTLYETNSKREAD